MLKRTFVPALAALLLLCVPAFAQYTPWLYWTFLPKDQMDEIIGESSGETAWNTIAEINAFNRERLDEEYAGNFLETRVIMDHLKRYGLADAQVFTYPGGPAWRAVKGEVWEMKPLHQKLVSMRDILPALAAGSAPSDVTAELVWVGRGTAKEIADAKVEGKIVVTEGSLMMAYGAAVQQGALGVIGIAMSRPYFDPLQMPWSGISFRGMGFEMGGAPPAKPGAKPADKSAPQPPAAAPKPPKFGFQMSAREGDFLKRRLLTGEKITVHAVVDSKTDTADLEDVVCTIPGTDPAAGEVILSAHLFEGFNKQGANDNVSGSATILEVARILNTLTAEGRLPKPRRTLRFIWGPEFSGIGKWVQANQPIMEKTLCNINMDMVGEWLSKNQSFFCLMRTTYGNPHYINDVMENYYRYIGEGNRERIQNRSTPSKIVPVRVVAPSGADEPFPYSIETHYGASDHEVFNDWGVGVPGIMMIAWPDKWYHTSGDVADKADPTQLKRAAIIGAAGAYTVASADPAMAGRIAGEIASNATRRLGHTLAAALEGLDGATAATLADDYKAARWLLEAAVMNEKETLDSVLELARGQAELAASVAQLKKAVDGVGAAEIAALDAQMSAAARRLAVKPVTVVLTDAEKKAAKIVPRPTAKIRANGYGEYRKLIDAVPAADKAKYPVRGKDLIISNPSELQLLVNGKHSLLDIKKMLDAQSERKSTLPAIENQLQILKLAGLVEF